MVPSLFGRDISWVAGLSNSKYAPQISRLSSAFCRARRRVPSVSDFRCLSAAALRSCSKRLSSTFLSKGCGSTLFTNEIIGWVPCFHGWEALQQHRSANSVVLRRKGCGANLNAEPVGSRLPRHGSPAAGLHELTLLVAVGYSLELGEPCRRIGCRVEPFNAYS